MDVRRLAVGRHPALRWAIATLTGVLLAGMLLAGCGTAGSPVVAPAAGDAAGDTLSDTAGAGSTSSPREPAGQSPTTQDEAEPGSYIDWDEYAADRAAYDDTHVVLFFHAPWCPSCRATEESLTADGVPDGLTIVKVDFDTATDLRQQYGVTVQHTFVLVEPDGNQVKKWAGTLSGKEIAEQIA